MSYLLVFMLILIIVGLFIVFGGWNEPNGN